MDTKIWVNMFSLGVPVLEKIMRPIIVYFFLIAGLRFFGKREIAQLNTFDFVVLLMLSNTVQNAIIGEDNSVIGGLIGVTALFAVNYLVVSFVYKHRKLEKLIEGEPKVLIKDGHVIMERLKDELITIDQLRTSLNEQGFKSFDEIEKALLEPNGAITFIPKKEFSEKRYREEALARLDQITKELAVLRASLNKT